MLRALTRGFLASATLVAIATSSLAAQTAPVVADLIKDVDGVQQKLVALAKAVPQEKYSWRPSAGVRSISEVFLHVVSDNYLMPALAGAAIPANMKLDMKDMKSFSVFEKRTVTREQAVAELEASFAFLKAAMQKSTAADMSAMVDMFGTKSTKQSMWVGTTTHLHEHLGQSIAYARMNGVVPPWSK